MDVHTSTQASRLRLLPFCVVINDAIALDEADDDEPTGSVIELLFV